MERLLIALTLVITAFAGAAAWTLAVATVLALAALLVVAFYGELAPALYWPGVAGLVVLVVAILRSPPAQAPGRRRLIAPA